LGVEPTFGLLTEAKPLTSRVLMLPGCVVPEKSSAVCNGSAAFRTRRWQESYGDLRIPNVGLLLTSGSESEQGLMAERLLYLQVHGWVGKSQRYPRNAVLEPNTDRIG
jgi:hypothetical protein